MATTMSPGCAAPTPHLIAPWPVTEVRVLSNGLTVVVTPLPHLHTAAATMFVRVGSRYERPEENGISHLLEHVLFRGCKRFPDVFEFNAAIERNAVGLGASTYRDFAAYDATCAPDRLAAVLDLMGAMLEAPTFSGVDLERGVILEEIADVVDDRGADVDVDNIAKAALFEGRGLGLKVGGTGKRLERLGEEDCRRWFEHHYRAGNMVLAVSGRVDVEAAFTAAAEAMGCLPEGPRRSPEPQRLRSDLPALEYVDYAGGPQSSVELCWVLPSEADPDWPALALAQRLLDDGTCARLRRKVIDEAGLAYHVECDLETFEGVALLTIEMTLSHDRVSEAVDLALAVVRELVDAPPSDEEWERARARFGFDLSSTVDSAPAVASWFGLQQLVAPHHCLEDRHHRVMSVERADLARACASHLSPSRVQLAVVGALEPLARAGLRRRLHRLRGN